MKFSRSLAAHKILGMDVSGSAYFDFFGGTGTALGQMVRLRIASVVRNETLNATENAPIGVAQGH